MDNYVRYKVGKGAVCPRCDRELSITVTVRGLFRKKTMRVLERDRFCRHCGCALRWVKDSE